MVPPSKPATTERKRAAAGAADRVRDAILSGRLRPGTDLPGERDLSEQLGVSRLTLRSAIARLEAEGLVQPVHGSGTRVLDYRESGSVDLLGYLAEAGLDGGEVPLGLLSDLLEVRRTVAVEVLGLVAERADTQDLARLRSHHARQATLIADPPAFIAADLDFARLLVRASRNLAFELLFNTVVRAVERNPALTIAFTANATTTLAVYDKLLGLVATRSAARVRNVARRLLERLDRLTLDRIAALSAAAAQEE